MTTAHHISTRQVVLAAIASLALMLVASPAFLASDIAALEGGARAPWRAVPADAPLSIDRATRARKALRRPTHARTWKMSYTAHNGALRDAVVVLPDWYGPHRHPPLPMVISPHGRGLNGASNARLWGDLPALGSFVLVSPDGEGRRRHDTSWGWRGQIDDLARMPKLVEKALPWLEIDATRVYAVGGSMGGQETLLLVASHPEVLAGAAAIDSVTDFALQYRNFPRLKCNARCRRDIGSRGLVLQGQARDEIGGTPDDAPAAYAERSAMSFAREVAASCVPLQVWWSSKDEIVVDSKLQSGRFVRALRAFVPRAAVEEYAGRWIHTRVMRADRQLPLVVERFGLLRDRWGVRPKLRYTATAGTGCAAR